MSNIGIEFVDSTNQATQVNDALNNASNATGDMLFVALAVIFAIIGIISFCLYQRIRHIAKSGSFIVNDVNTSTSITFLADRLSNVLSKRLLLCTTLFAAAASVLFFAFSFCGFAFAGINDSVNRNPVNLEAPSKIKAFVHKDTNTVDFEDLVMTNTDASAAFVNTVALTQNYGDEDKSTWKISVIDSSTATDKLIYDDAPNNSQNIDGGIQIDQSKSSTFVINSNMSTEFASSLIGHSDAYSLSFISEDLPYPYEYAKEPTIDKDCTYTGQEQSPITSNDTITLSGDISATDAGTYTFYATPNSGYVWSDLSTDAKQFSWTMNKAEAVLNLDASVDASTSSQTIEITYSYTGDGKGSATSVDASVVSVEKLEQDKIIASPHIAGCTNIALSFSSGKNYNAIVKQIQVNVSQQFSGKMYYPLTIDSTMASIDIGFNWDPVGFINTDNTQYNKDIAVLGSILIGDYYPTAKVSIDGYDPWPGSDNLSLYTKVLGMQDVKDIYLNSNDYEYDKDDISSFMIAHRPFVDNGVTKELIFVACKGTSEGSIAEWSSDFDVGNSSEAYSQYVHPQWSDKKTHKGFEVISNRFMPLIDEYINQYVDNNAQKNIFFTGHSKGASVSNLLGKNYNTDSKYADFKTFVYSYATAPAYQSSGTVKYDNIFEICNYDDAICYVPPHNWGFESIGTEIGFDAKSNQAFLQKWKEQLGIDYEPAEGNMMGDMIQKSYPDRETIYNQYLPSEVAPYQSDLFDTKEEAMDEYNNFMKGIKYFRMDKYNKCELLQNDDGQYYYQATLTPAALFQVLAGLVVAGETGDMEIMEMLMYVAPVVSSMPEDLQEIMETITDHITGIVHAHGTFSYYFIVSQ